MFKDLISSVYIGTHVEVRASPMEVIILSFRLDVALGNET